MIGPLREPAEETEGLYPGLVVHDGRQTGSITLGRSRLPVWAVMAALCDGAWEAVELGWPQVADYGWDERRFAAFLCNLTESRGEFARLLLILANVERQYRSRAVGGWWAACDRKLLVAQLKRCLAVLEAP